MKSLITSTFLKVNQLIILVLTLMVFIGASQSINTGLDGSVNFTQIIIKSGILLLLLLLPICLEIAYQRSKYKHTWIYITKIQIASWFMAPLVLLFAGVWVGVYIAIVRNLAILFERIVVG